MPAPETDKQMRFAAAYAENGGNTEKAAIDAGYSPKSAYDLGRRALKLPHVQDMIMSELARQRSRAGAVGFNALVEVAQNKATPAAAKVAAGRALMEFAQLIGAGTAKSPNPGQHYGIGTAVPDYTAILNMISVRITQEHASKAEPITILHDEGELYP